MPPSEPTDERPEPEDAEFDWQDETVALREQRETAIYWNSYGNLVIRQRAWPDDDPFVVISANNVQDFIDRLCDMAGIGSAGRP